MTPAGKRDLLAAILTALLALLAVVSLAGCESRTYLGAIADARAGAQAATAADAKARSAILESVGRRVLALTDGIPDLPAPTQTPAEIAANPADYCATTPPAPAYEAPPPPPPSIWQRFRSLGDRMITWGGIACAVGSVLLLVGWGASWLGWAGPVWSILGSPLVSGLARLAASLGGTSAILGTWVAWAADCWWAILIAGALTIAIIGIAHRKGLAKIWQRITKGRA